MDPNSFSRDGRPVLGPEEWLSLQQAAFYEHPELQAELALVLEEAKKQAKTNQY